MKIKILTILIALLFFGCDDSANKNRTEVKGTQQISNYKLELIESLKLNDDIDKVLFVPDNSCKGCLKHTIDICEDLSGVEGLKLYYFNELNSSLNNCARNKEPIKLIMDYTNYDIYGITLFKLLKDSIAITYVDANNIDSVYKELLN
jgi:hypothetical protein